MQPEVVVKKWTELTRDELHAILRLRIDVFVVEQACPYPDLDGKDFNSDHIFLLKEGMDTSSGASAAAYIRVCHPGVIYKEPSIGRVVTAQDERGKALGRRIMQEGIEYCNKKWPRQGIRISAQKYLTKFYEDLGFEVCSEPYLEDDIPHVQMFRK
jgi:ElaA protein